MKYLGFICTNPSSNDLAHSMSSLSLTRYPDRASFSRQQSQKQNMRKMYFVQLFIPLLVYAFNAYLAIFECRRKCQLSPANASSALTFKKGKPDWGLCVGVYECVCKNINVMKFPLQRNSRKCMRTTFPFMIWSLFSSQPSGSFCNNGYPQTMWRHLRFSVLFSHHLITRVPDCFWVANLF